MFDYCTAFDEITEELFFMDNRKSYNENIIDAMIREKQRVELERKKQQDIEHKNRRKELYEELKKEFGNS